MTSGCFCIHSYQSTSLNFQGYVVLFMQCGINQLIGCQWMLNDWKIENSLSRWTHSLGLERLMKKEPFEDWKYSSATSTSYHQFGSTPCACPLCEKSQLTTLPSGRRFTSCQNQPCSSPSYLPAYLLTAHKVQGLTLNAMYIGKFNESIMVKHKGPSLSCTRRHN